MTNSADLDKAMIDINEYIERRRLALMVQSPGSIAWTRGDTRPMKNAEWTKSKLPENPSNSKKWQTAVNITKGFMNMTRRPRKPAAWRAFSEVSVAGISAALDRHSPPLRRILWAVVLIVCAALMFAQCLDRVNRYVAEPINVNVKITHNDSLEYPAITVCNKNVFNRTKALDMMIEYQLVPPNATDAQVNISLLIGVSGMTPDTVWTHLSQQRHIFFAECWFGRGVTCDEQGKWTPVHTVMGPCYTYMINNTHVSAVGGFHNLYMNMRETTPIHKDESGVRILVHNRRDSPILAARTSSMSAELGWSREVKLELRKILNTETSPCNDDFKYSLAQCELNCFQQFMLEVSKCRMPYMSGPLFANVSECMSPNDYEEAMSAINAMLLSGGWSTSLCKCPQECHQTAFQMYPENMAFKQNEIKLRIFYDNLVFEQITEEKAYTLISLLCDIGGTLGLLMGASVLTVCELLEVAWSNILQRCCRLEERQPPGNKAADTINYRKQRGAPVSITIRPL